MYSHFNNNYLQQCASISIQLTSNALPMTDFHCRITVLRPTCDRTAEQPCNARTKFRTAPDNSRQRICVKTSRMLDSEPDGVQRTRGCLTLHWLSFELVHDIHFIQYLLLQVVTLCYLQILGCQCSEKFNNLQNFYKGIQLLYIVKLEQVGRVSAKVLPM